MNRGWKLLILGLALALTSTQVEAQTHYGAPAVNGAVTQAYSQHYHVYYRYCATHSWQYYGCYDCPFATQAAVDSLQQRGYQTRVVC